MSAAQITFDRFFSGPPASAPLSAEDRLPPRSRSTDALSSHRAEANAKRTGQMRGQRVIVLALIDKYPGRTSKQLGELGTLDRYQIARRCRELVKLKLVREPKEESDYIKGQELRWWPARIR